MRAPGIALSALCAVSFVAGAAFAQEVPTPESAIGHAVGEDRHLATYDQVLAYVRSVEAVSPRVSVESLGGSTLGNEMALAVLTSPANQENLPRIREIGRQLANPDELEAGALDQLVEEGKAVLLVTCTIHSTEVGCTQMAMELVHEFATTTDPDRVAWMNDVVLLLMLSLNPDGQVLVVDWYDRYVGTEYEGGRMPWLYHHYVGHDNNRDHYMLTQRESQVLNDVLYHRWFPQVFVDEHQMGSLGPRMFVPPQTDPLAGEIHSLIFRMADVIGTNMSYRLEEAGKLGVGHDMIYDSYWPGGTRNTAWWKNVTGLLTEVASASIATPIYVDPGELEGGRKGFPQYQRRSNFPSPWPGGWWRLRDIVEYELVATWAALESCSVYKREILRNFHTLGAEAISAGETDTPAAWIVEPEQHDPVAARKLVELLLRHGIRVEQSRAPFQVGRATYPADTHVIPAAQPYRAFLLTMLRPQRYPEVVPYEGGPVIPPYDVTSWSLPISMGVEVTEVEAKPDGLFERVETPNRIVREVREARGGYLVSHAADTAFTAMNRLLAAGTQTYWLTAPPSEGRVGDIWIPPGQVGRDQMQALVDELHLPVVSLAERPSGEALAVLAARVGLYKPWVASMDEGWTRFLLEQYEFPHTNLTNQDLREGAFGGSIDVLLLPDVDADILRDGEPESELGRRFWTPLPPEYAGGIGEEGGKHLRTWIESGGTVVALDSSATYLAKLLRLPVNNVLAGSATVDAPGTMLRILVDTSHPLGYGLREEEAAYFASSPVFRTRLPDARFDRRVVARYPDHREDVLVSGYLVGAEHLIRRAAMVEIEVGLGRVVLIGFRAQHRAQPLRTFKLLFNALYGLEPVLLDAAAP